MAENSNRENIPRGRQDCFLLLTLHSLQLGCVFSLPSIPCLKKGPSAKTYLASGTPLLRQDTRYSDFAPLTLGAPRAGLPPSLAPGESGGTLAIQPYPGRYWLHNLTPLAS